MLLLVTSFMIAQATAAQPAVSSQSCTGEAYAALDFWIGDWDVYRNGTETVVARSTIEKLYAGCAVRENWDPRNGKGGGSLSGFDPVSRRWHQTWIGSRPGVVSFEGGPVDGSLVLTGWWAGSGPNGEDGLTRMTYMPTGNGDVRQLGEFSADHGLTWQTSFDFIYRRRPAD